MNVAGRLGLVHAEAAALEDFDNAGRLWIDHLPTLAILLRDADHLRVAAEEHVGRRRVEWPAQVLLQLPGRNQVLNINLAPYHLRLARHQAQVGVIRITRLEDLVQIPIAQVAAVADAAGRQDASGMTSA